MRITLPLLLALLTTANIACSQTDQRLPPDVETRIKRVEENLATQYRIKGQPGYTLKERMAHFHINGLSIAVIHNYRIEWAKGYGWADSAEQRPVTTQTLFQAASISKSLNAVGVLKLVQERKLDLYADINNYLTSWKFPYDSLSKNKKITVANLLSHTGGLTIHGFPGYEKGDTLPTLVLVLDPLGMSASFYTQPAPAAKASLLATAYHVDGKEVKGNYHIYPEEAPAGLWTNPTDLARYIIETQLAYEGKSAKVLNQQSAVYGWKGFYKPENKP